MAWNFDWLTPSARQAQQAHKARLDRIWRGQPTGRAMVIGGVWYGRSHGLLGVNEIDMLAQPRRWVQDVLADMAAKAELAADQATFRPLAIEPDCLGVHYIDALLGMPAFFHEGQAWAESFPGDVADLPRPDLSRSEAFRASLELAAIAVEAAQAAGGAVHVTTPVLSCPINIGMNLFGQRLLEALLERPAAARHALRVIADVILEAIAAFGRVIPEPLRRGSVALDRFAPEGFGQIDGCATQLLSPAVYAEFFAPLDAELLGAYGRGGMMHLCGAHVQHLPAWRAMPELRALQLNDRATDDFETYYRGLRDDQVIYVSPNRAWPVERIMALTAGRRVVLQTRLKSPILVNQ